MASDAYLKDVAKKLTQDEDVAKLAARYILAQTLELAKEMSHDRGNDPETRQSCLDAQTNPDELVSQASDGIYAMMVDDFFDQVSEQLVKLAPEYVTR